MPASYFGLGAHYLQPYRKDYPGRGLEYPRRRTAAMAAVCTRYAVWFALNCQEEGRAGSIVLLSFHCTVVVCVYYSCPEVGRLRLPRPRGAESAGV